MAFNVDQFKSNVMAKGGMAKASHFQVVITPPTMVGATGLKGVSQVTREIPFRTEVAQFPGRSILTTDDKRHGYGLISKPGYATIYPEVQCVFLCGSDLKERSFFSDWQNLVIGNHSTLPNDYLQMMDVGYYNDYVGTVEIQQMDPLSELNAAQALASQFNVAGFNVGQVLKDVGVFAPNADAKVVHKVKLVDAYPTVVNAVDLNWSSDDFIRLAVQFTYKHYDESAQIQFTDVGGNRLGIDSDLLNLAANVINNPRDIVNAAGRYVVKQLPVPSGVKKYFNF